MTVSTSLGLGYVIIEKFMAQFGISGDPQVTETWKGMEHIDALYNGYGEGGK
eukprot:gene27447-34164_t